MLVTYGVADTVTVSDSLYNPEIFMVLRINSTFDLLISFLPVKGWMPPLAKTDAITATSLVVTFMELCFVYASKTTAGSP